LRAHTDYILSGRQAALDVGHELGDEAGQAMAEVCCHTQMHIDEIDASGGGAQERIWMGDLPQPPPEPQQRKGSKRKRAAPGETVSQLHARVAADDLQGVMDILQGAQWDPKWDEEVGDTELRLVPPIIQAAKVGSVEVLSVLIDARANLDAIDEFGKTALHYAAMEGQEAACKRLLEAGARWTAENDKGSSPLHLAAEVSCCSIVKTLIDAKAEVNARDGDGDTPLHLAAHAVKARTRREEGDNGNLPDIATVELLLEAGADPALSRPIAPRLAWMLCKDKQLKGKLREAAEVHTKDRSELMTPAAQRVTRRSSPSSAAAGESSRSPGQLVSPAARGITVESASPALVDPGTASPSDDDRNSNSTRRRVASKSGKVAANSSNSREPTFLFHHQNTTEQAEALQRYQEIVERLGGVVVADFENDTQLTHLVTFGLRRSEKVICAVAKGCFIVSPAYLEACDEAGVFIGEEEDFPPDTSDKTSSAIWSGAASRWREKWESEGKGPFSGLRVLINGETKPNLKALSRMISAGGGTVEVELGSGRDKLKVDLAVLGPPSAAAVAQAPSTAPTRPNVNSTWLQWVERHSVKVVAGTYFVECICNREPPTVEDHMRLLNMHNS